MSFVVFKPMMMSKTTIITMEIVTAKSLMIERTWKKNWSLEYKYNTEVSGWKIGSINN